MNATFKVKTLFSCDVIEDYKQINNQDSILAQTVFGCRLLFVLKEMYGFNMTYVFPNTTLHAGDERTFSVYPRVNDSVDIYAKPMAFSRELLEISCPVEAIFKGRYGFILKRPYSSVLRRFYSLPFTRPVWNCIYVTILVVSGVFFYLSRWEKKLLGGYSCYHYELLFVIGALCQHILPLHANMLSRRIAYISFILSVYVLNSFYSSNLLSHLVSDKDNSMDLRALADSDYECVKLGYGNGSVEPVTYKFQLNTNMSIMEKKLFQARYMNIVDGLNAVMTTKTALLSDYSILYPVLARMFDTDEICQLIEIDLYSNIKKYIYTSKTFPFMNELKMGILRVKETGVIQRILNFQTDVLPPLNCAYTYPMMAEFEQIIIPLSILLGSFIVATLIMLLERLHYRRNKVFPYVD